jgi:hypothetical protein
MSRKEKAPFCVLKALCLSDNTKDAKRDESKKRPMPTFDEVTDFDGEMPIFSMKFHVFIFFL